MAGVGGLCRLLLFFILFLCSFSPSETQSSPAQVRCVDQKCHVPLGSVETLQDYVKDTPTKLSFVAGEKLTLFGESSNYFLASRVTDSRKGLVAKFLAQRPTIVSKPLVNVELRSVLPHSVDSVPGQQRIEHEPQPSPTTRCLVDGSVVEDPELCLSMQSSAPTVTMYDVPSLDTSSATSEDIESARSDDSTSGLLTTFTNFMRSALGQEIEPSVTSAPGTVAKTIDVADTKLGNTAVNNDGGDTSIHLLQTPDNDSEESDLDGSSSGRSTEKTVKTEDTAHSPNSLDDISGITNRKGQSALQQSAPTVSVADKKSMSQLPNQPNNDNGIITKENLSAMSGTDMGAFPSPESLRYDDGRQPMKHAQSTSSNDILIHTEEEFRGLGIGSTTKDDTGFEGVKTAITDLSLENPSDPVGTTDVSSFSEMPNTLDAVTEAFSDIGSSTIKRGSSSLPESAPLISGTNVSDVSLDSVDATFLPPRLKGISAMEKTGVSANSVLENNTAFESPLVSNKIINQKIGTDVPQGAFDTQKGILSSTELPEKPVSAVDSNDGASSLDNASNAAEKRTHQEIDQGSKSESIVKTHRISESKKPTTSDNTSADEPVAEANSTPSSVVRHPPPENSGQQLPVTPKLPEPKVVFGRVPPKVLPPAARPTQTGYGHGHFVTKEPHHGHSHAYPSHSHKEHDHSLLQNARDYAHKADNSGSLSDRVLQEVSDIAIEAESRDRRPDLSQDASVVDDRRSEPVALDSVYSQQDPHLSGRTSEGYSYPGKNSATEQTATGDAVYAEQNSNVYKLTSLSESDNKTSAVSSPSASDLNTSTEQSLSSLSKSADTADPVVQTGAFSTVSNDGQSESSTEETFSGSEPSRYTVNTLEQTCERKDNLACEGDFLAAPEASNEQSEQANNLSKSKKSRMGGQHSDDTADSAVQEYVSLVLSVIPDPLHGFLWKLENEHGVSSHVVVLTFLCGFVGSFLLLFLSCIAQTSKESALSDFIARLEQQLFALKKEREILLENATRLKEGSYTSEGNSVGVTDVAAEALLSEKYKQELESVRENAVKSQDEVKRLQTVADELQIALRASQEGLASLEASRNAEREEADLKQQELVEELNELRIVAEESQSKIEETEKTIKEKNNLITELRSSNAQLLQEAQVWDQRVKELSARLKDDSSQLASLQAEVAEKELELAALKETLKKFDGFKNMQGKFEGNEEDMVKSLIDVERLRLENERLQSRNASLETDNKAVRSELTKQESDIKELKENIEQALKEKVESEQKLAVLSDYFKDKELKLQRDVVLQESLRLKKENDALSVSEQLELYREQNVNFQAQLTSIKEELDVSERRYKRQLMEQEKKTHENWMAFKNASKTVEELQVEMQVLRQQLVIARETANRSRDSLPFMGALSSPGLSSLPASLSLSLPLPTDRPRPPPPLPLPKGVQTPPPVPGFPPMPLPPLPPLPNGGGGKGGSDLSTSSMLSRYHDGANRRTPPVGVPPLPSVLYQTKSGSSRNSSEKKDNRDFEKSCDLHHHRRDLKADCGDFRSSRRSRKRDPKDRGDSDKRLRRRDRGKAEDREVASRPSEASRKERQNVCNALANTYFPEGDGGRKSANKANQQREDNELPTTSSEPQDLASINIVAASTTDGRSILSGGSKGEPRSPDLHRGLSHRGSTRRSRDKQVERSYWDHA